MFKIHFQSQDQIIRGIWLVWEKKYESSYKKITFPFAEENLLLKETLQQMCQCSNKKLQNEDQYNIVSISEITTKNLPFGDDTQVVNISRKILSEKKRRNTNAF